MLSDIKAHLVAYVAPAPDAWMFCGPRGAPLMRTKLPQGVARGPHVAVGRPDLHFHDLRHLAATLAATAGATTRELMLRRGHTSPRAALIYQHATRDRDAAIAAALSELALATVTELPQPPTAEASR